MRKFNQLAVPVTAVALTLMAIGGPTQEAGAAKRPAHQRTEANAPGVGNDVSYPQCGSRLPKGQAFGIVGLNDTLGNNFNPCFSKEVAWAEKSIGSTAVPKLSVYVHVENPGSKVPDWPKTGTNSDGICNGKNTAACSYQYGENLATNDLDHLTKAKLASLMIFMDVETNYSWENTNHDQYNVATMEGMTATFQQAGDTVGVYSNSLPWQQITGGDIPSSSNLANLPEWVLGGHNKKTAEDDCVSNTFLGKAILAQIAGSNYLVDQDIAC